VGVAGDFFLEDGVWVNIIWKPSFFMLGIFRNIFILNCVDNAKPRRPAHDLLELLSQRDQLSFEKMFSPPLD